MKLSLRLRSLPFTVLILALWLTGHGSLLAQEFRASIIGQVNDASGAPIPGASITAVEHSTNQTYTAKSNSAGVYSVDFVLPGQYTVTVEAPGMSKQVFSNVTLQAVQKLNLNVTLTVGQVNQEVTVNASPGLLDTATAAGGGRCRPGQSRKHRFHGTTVVG